MKIPLINAVLVTMATMTLPAQMITVLHSFNGYPTDGSSPQAPLIQGPDGTLYGTTTTDGVSPNFYGSVFKIQPDGSGYQVLWSFSGFPSAQAPQSELLVTNNTLYGTTINGGAAGLGTIFKVNTDGLLPQVLYQFSARSGPGLTNTDGANPSGRLVLGGSVLYGTAQIGGFYGRGTVFAFDTSGSNMTAIHSFPGGSTNNGGINPEAGLVLSGNTLYGTTYFGGSSNYSYGTVFRLNTDGNNFTVLRAFTNGEPASPSADLILNGSMLYGTSQSGGFGQGTVFKINTNGTGFSVVYAFKGGLGVTADGALPYGGLALNGNTLYGTTLSGGTNGNGSVFRVNTDGTGYALLKSFSGVLVGGTTNNDSAKPYGGLVVSGGNLYGTGSSGGKSGQGSIFSLPYPYAIATNLVHNGNGSFTLNFQVGTNYAYVL
jgi:uncharacterized repeat protein (TIGR03803 family)